MDVERIARSVGRREDAFGLQSRKLTTKSPLIPACLAAAHVCDWAHYFSPAESGLVQTFWRACGDPRTTWSNRRPTSSCFEVFRGFKGFEYLIFEYFWYLDMFSLFHSFPAGGSYFASVGRVLLNGRRMLILATLARVARNMSSWEKWWKLEVFTCYLRIIYILFSELLFNFIICYLYFPITPCASGQSQDLWRPHRFGFWMDPGFHLRRDFFFGWEKSEVASHIQWSAGAAGWG